MVQGPGAKDDVEGARPQCRALKVGLDELDTIETKASRGRRAKEERCAREIGAYHHASRMRQVQTHLTSSASNLDHASSGRDGLIQ
jgi:hypothetical protein